MNRAIKIQATYFISLVWFINGLFCKLLNLVPRHQQIVARILGDEYAALLTRTIGVLEIGMAFWVLSGIRSRLAALLQIILIATMNVIEAIAAPDLLLFGRANAFVALLFILVIYFNEFKNQAKPKPIA